MLNMVVFLLIYKDWALHFRFRDDFFLLDWFKLKLFVLSRLLKLFTKFNLFIVVGDDTHL